MTTHKEPPAAAIVSAIEIGTLSPCWKSQRGSVIYIRLAAGGLIVSRGHNSPPGKFMCDGSEGCRAACREICVHAEAAALLSMKAIALGPDERCELLHVKVERGVLQVSGPPSCHRCSAMILAEPTISLVWLYHASGWQSYSPEDFHLLSLRANNLPSAARD